MYSEAPIWPKEVEWYKPESWDLIPEQLPVRVGDRALPVPAEKLRGLPGSPELTELMDGLRALKVARATRGRLYRVQHPEEPDRSTGRRKQPPERQTTGHPIRGAVQTVDAGDGEGRPSC